ncbi:MAG: pseudouridine synthase [Aquabacterium sp.]
MTTDNVPMQEPNEQPSVTDEVAKPKRAPRKKAAEDGASASGVTPSATAEDGAVPAKKAVRRKKVAEEAVPGDAAPADAALSAVQAEEAPAKPKRAPRKKAADAVQADAAPVQASFDLAVPEVRADLPREEAPHGFFQLAPETDAPAAQADGAVGEGEQAEGGREAGQRQERGNRRDRDRGRGPRGDRGERGDRPPHPERPQQSFASADGEGEGVEFEDEEGSQGEDGEQRPSRRAAMAAEQATEVYAELLSGDFDTAREEESEEAASEEGGVYKRVLRPEPDAPKLQKVLAQAGVGSRRDIEQMIEDGRIEVNDQVAHIGQRISFGDRIKVAGRPIKVRIQPPAARILAYHKPTGEVVTHDDPQGRPTVFRRLPRLQNGKWMSVGRLDLNTEGLLLFTNSGELANQLMHPRFGVEREYAVRVLGTLDDASRHKLLTGVEIEGQSASFVSISKGEGEGVNQWYRVVITEGRNREVRKLFDAVGLTVNRLIRVRYGAIVLPRGLKRGVWVELGESDVRAVKSLAGMDRQDFGQQQQGRGGKNQRGQQGSQQQGFKGKQGRGPQQGQGQGQGGRQGQGNGQYGNQGGQGAQGNQGGYGNKPPRGPMPDRQNRAQAAPRHDMDDDFEHIGNIPNPLEQTFDKRFVKGSKRITSGFGRPDQDHGKGMSQPKGGPKQPDPLQTSVGYIGADAYFGKVGGGNRRGGGGGGGRGRR